MAEVDWTLGLVRNLSKNTSLHGQPVPKPLQDIVKSGGVDVALREEGYLSAASLQDRR
jgi:3-isopropylmalate/(R)-2-methylmalate dehydratase small subunit